jgi:callose synthase
MASTSGTKGPFEISRQPSKRMIRAPTRTVELPNEENIMDSEIVPSSLAVLVPILRAAIEIEGENPRVAYLCEFFFHFFLPFLLNYILYYIHIHL